MSRTKSGKTLLFLLLSVLILGSSLRISAAIDEATLEEIEQEVAAFLGNAYTLPEESLATLRESGGFYDIMVRSWHEDREVTGDFVDILSTSAEAASDGQIAIHSVVEFEKYTSDVILYFDEAELRPVNYVMDIRYSMKEKMTQAAQNMAVGLIVVFVVLIFLMCIISLFRFLAPKPQDRKAEPPTEKPVSAESAAQASDTPVPDVLPEAVSPASAEEEIVAVMAAAIAAASAEAPSPTGYVVRSVRREGRSAWTRIG